MSNDRTVIDTATVALEGERVEARVVEYGGERRVQVSVQSAGGDAEQRVFRTDLTTAVGVLRALACLDSLDTKDSIVRDINKNAAAGEGDSAAAVITDDDPSIDEFDF